MTPDLESALNFRNVGRLLSWPHWLLQCGAGRRGKSCDFFLRVEARGDCECECISAIFTPGRESDV